MSHRSVRTTQRTAIKSLRILLLAWGLVAAKAQDEGYEEIIEKIRKSERSVAEIVREERDLKAQLESLRTSPENKEKLQHKLEEAGELHTLLVQEVGGLKDNLRVLQPAHIVTTAIAKDRRHPTKEDISGVWIFRLTGGARPIGGNSPIIRLEQRGMAVTGKGYRRGCTGFQGLIKIQGSYKAGLLSFTIVDVTWDELEIRRSALQEFVYSPEQERPRFEDLKTRSEQVHKILEPARRRN